MYMGNPKVFVRDYIKLRNRNRYPSVRILVHVRGVLHRILSFVISICKDSEKLSVFRHKDNRLCLSSQTRE